MKTSSIDISKLDPRKRSPLQKGLAASPAMIMALGIWSKFALNHSLLRLFSPSITHIIQLIYAILLGLWGLYLIHLLVNGAHKNYLAVWDYDIKHFAIGTWVAGTNVYASVIFPFSRYLATVLNGISFILWLMYMRWYVTFFSMVMHHRETLHGWHGLSFLTTVSTQSVVITYAILFPNSGSLLYIPLLLLWVLGVAFYFLNFYLVWIRVGVAKEYRKWTPANNITHGALSITVLAAEFLYLNHFTTPGFLMVINIIWAIDAIFFVVVFFIEVSILLGNSKKYFTFSIGNFARNFTYGMFFASTFLGSRKITNSWMQFTFNTMALDILSVFPFVVNIWEISHMLVVSIGSCDNFVNSMMASTAESSGVSTKESFSA